MQNIISYGALFFLLVILSSLVDAQQTKNIPRIGYLSPDLHPADSRVTSPHSLNAFREGMRQLGYIEGKNIIIEYRYAEGRYERLPALAEELVRLPVEIIVATNSTSALGAKKATSAIPIVIASGSDPIRSGLVASLAQPGGNVTGLTNLYAELLGKRLALLKEVVPKVARFAFLDDAEGPSAAMFQAAQLTAQTLVVKFQLVEVKAPNPDIDGAFRLRAKERIGALVTSSGFLGGTLHRKKVLQRAEQNRMPAMHSNRLWTDDGGLLSYGVNSQDLYRRAATYVDKILKGAKPADLPVEQPMKFDFVINLKAAKQIGQTIPQSVLYRADRVIK